MKKGFTLIIIVLCLFASCAQETGITIDATKKMHQASIKLNGANVEDLNFQGYGGMYSQLLYGQDFEEFIDVDFLNLPTVEPNVKSMVGPVRYVTFVVLDENNKPYLTTTGFGWGLNPIGGNPVSKHYELDSKKAVLTYWFDEAKELENTTGTAGSQGGNREDGGGQGGMTQGNIHGRTPKGIGKVQPLIPIDSLPQEEQKNLNDIINGDKVINRYWKEISSGNAKGVFKMPIENTYNGRRDQSIEFVSGTGEVGLDNMGLMRMGIYLQEGKNYDGVLRVRNPQNCNLYVALLSADGTEKLAEKTINLKASPTSFQKVEFDLVPSKTDVKGRFAVILKAPGEITLGYAFLEPGLWGRVKGGYPIRQDFVDQLKGNGMNIIRYNGAMNNACPDSMIYMWKNMIGPRDERLPYTGTFSPYATHGFGIFEFLMVAEAAGLEGVVGISKYENPSEIKHMIEYANGDVTTKWGAMRAKDGHPDPLNLRSIQISNEQSTSGAKLTSYIENFKTLATEIWKADSTITCFVSWNIGSRGNLVNVKPGDRSNEDYNQIRNFLKWVKDHGREGQFAWDSHYTGSIEPEINTYKSFGLYLQEVVKEDIGFKLRLYPLEENGAYHTFDRGIAHALQQNRLNRWGDRIEGAATANMFQPEITYFTFSQGRVFYESDRFWNNTSGHVDQMVTKEWLPWVLDVKAEIATDSLDVLVKESDDGKVVSMYVVNYGIQSKTRNIYLNSFTPKADVLITQLGPYPLTARNSGSNPNYITPKIETKKLRGTQFKYQFPEHSFTVIRIERE